MSDPRLTHAEWHLLGNVYTYRMPWNLELWATLRSMQENGIKCPSCGSFTSHLNSCNIWCDVAEYENKLAAIGMPGIEAVEARKDLEIEYLLGPDGPTEETLTRRADGRFSASDQEMILQDEAICQLIKETTCSETTAEQCRKVLQDAAKCGYKE